MLVGSIQFNTSFFWIWEKYFSNKKKTPMHIITKTFQTILLFFLMSHTLDICLRGHYTLLTAPINLLSCS